MLSVHRRSSVIDSSPLCSPDQLTERSADDLAQLYDDDVFTGLGDIFAPLKQVTRRPRRILGSMLNVARLTT